jgi:hypothetical protein
VAAWLVRQPRFWLAFFGWLFAVILAAADDRLAWTGFVALVVGMLAGLSVRAQYEAEHPERQAARDAKFQREVDKILWRYDREAAARARQESARSDESR